MKRIFVALAFACVFSIPTLAGEIPSDGAPKPQSQQTTSPTLLGEIPSGGASISDAAIYALLTALGLASI
jgi:hypothetical protein